MKKLISVLMAFVLMLALVACGGNNKTSSTNAETNAPQTTQAQSESTKTPEKEEWVPKGPITLVIGFSAGGGTDIGARVLVPFLEKELGVTVNVENVTGGSGWVCWNQVANAAADGYTFCMINTPSIYGGILDPSRGITKSMDDFTPLGNQVSDDNILVVSKDSKFQSVKEVIDAAKGGEILTVATTGAGTDDEICLAKIEAAEGIDLEPVAFDGTSDGKAATLGNNVDMLICNVSEVANQIADGEFRGLAVFAAERNDFVPDVPTYGEVGSTTIIASVNRGFAMPKCDDPAIIKTLSEALGRAITNEDCIKQMDEMFLKTNYMNAEQHSQNIKEEFAYMDSIKEQFGWK